MALRGRCLVKLQQIYLRTWYYSIKHVSWSIGNQREKLLDRCPSIRLASLQCETLSAKTATLSIQPTCRVESCSCNTYACWPSDTVTNTAAVQTCLMVECCCKIDACWTMATQSACLLTLFHSILHVCRRCASLSAIPAGMVSLYQPCLLVYMVSHYQLCLLAWCFIIGHAFRFGTSLSTMPVGVVPHYMPCLLVWRLTVGHVFLCGASL